MAKLTFRRNAIPQTPTVSVEQLELTSLADQINAAHLEVEQSYRRALQAAYVAGQALLEAKRRLNHGEFLPWLSANCQFSERSAQRYMAIAQHWEPLQLESKSATVADFGIREADKEIRLYRREQKERPEQVDVKTVGVGDSQVEILIRAQQEVIEAIAQSIAFALEQQGATLEQISPATLVGGKTRPASARVYVRATLPLPAAGSNPSRSQARSQSTLQKSGKSRG